MLVGIDRDHARCRSRNIPIAPPHDQHQCDLSRRRIAETLESAVTQIIEQQLTGIDGCCYFQSSSNAAGSVTINADLRARAPNPDIAQVQVQNKLQAATCRGCRSRCSSRASRHQGESQRLPDLRRGLFRRIRQECRRTI
jgi:hypothetical protein